MFALHKGGIIEKVYGVNNVGESLESNSYGQSYMDFSLVNRAENLANSFIYQY
jgi:hypothetical protein